MDEREARFLMRQRGAGTRNVDDFSFTVGAASDGMSTSDDGSRSDVAVNDNTVERPVRQDPLSTQQDTRSNDNAAREERFQMRRRGAGTREQNVDFSLHLGAPVTSSPITRASDAGSTSSGNSRLAARTNALKQEFVAAPSPLRQNARQSLSRTTGVGEDANATKRRRPSSQAEEEVGAVEAEDADFFDDGGAEGEYEENVPAERAAASADSPQASANGSAKRRRKKKSVLRKPKKRKIAASASSVASSTITEENESTGTEETTQTGRQALTETGHIQQPISSASRLENDDVAAEESVVQLNAGTTNDDQAPASSEQPKLFNIFNRSDRPPTMPINQAVQRVLNQHGLSNKENRPLQVRSKPTTATTAKSAKAKASSTKTTRKRREGQAKQKSIATHGLAENNNEVAITVRRVANISHLNFLSANDDDLQAEQIPALRQKRAPNAIDVLAQICREIIDKRVKALAVTEDTKSSSTHKRQTETIRRFSDELDSRLLLMTTALDHSISLTQSLKEATRQKATQRTNLLTLRQRRHEIDLQQDALRAANEAQTNLSSERFELNSLLADIQLAVQRGKEDSHRDSSDVEPRTHTNDADTLQSEREALSARIQQVSEKASSADGRQGLLLRVQAVNALLERVLASSSSGSSSASGSSLSNSSLVEGSV